MELTLYTGLSLSAAFLYLLLLWWITIGWFRLQEREPGAGNAEVTVSVIVPARNEALVISRCLSSLAAQHYPENKFEILVIDDHSSDDTARIVQTFIDNHAGVRIKLLPLSTESGKKQAILHAMKVASGELILCTDADCQHPPAWISTMAGFFASGKPVFIAGPVVLNTRGGFSGLFQETEFASLIASGAGSIGMRTPTMCNGANLGFSAEAFRSLNSDALKSAIGSGDDVFLMMSVKQKFGPSGIGFLKSRDALVVAEGKDKLSDYLKQRFRWVSKSHAYRDSFLIFTALTVFTFNSAILLTAFLAMFDRDSRLLLLILFAIKVIADSGLLASFLSFAGKARHLWLTPLLQPLVIVFTVVAAVAGNIYRGEWKGRRVN